MVHNSGLVIYESPDGTAERVSSALETVFGGQPGDVTVDGVCYACYYLDLCPEFVVLTADRSKSMESKVAAFYAKNQMALIKARTFYDPGDFDFRMLRE